MKAEIIPPEPKRPAEFTDDIFTEVCDRMAGGQGLRKICDDPAMPSRQTFLRWIEKDSGRQAKYQAAREALMDWYAEEILEIAWDSSKDTIPAEGKKPARCDNEWVNRSRLKVDTLKFLMAKLHPKRYGDKVPEQEAERDLKISWQNESSKMVGVKVEREIIDPLHDDNGKIINAADPSALRSRILELEDRLGIRDGKALPPKQLIYDPGPLPSRTEGQILYSIAQAIKNNVPKADQRSPEEVISEVMAEFEKVLQAKYGSDGLAA